MRKKNILFISILLVSISGCVNEHADPSDALSSDAGIIIRADAGDLSLKTTIIQEMRSSRRSIKIAARNISDPSIIAAMKKAKEHDIDISCVVDSKHVADTSVVGLIRSGIAVHGRSYDELMGSNFIIIDDDLIFLGVFDLENSESQFGFTFLIRDDGLLKRFIGEYAILFKGSDALTKDSDFDSTLGPFDEMLRKNSNYDAGWYNEISLSTGDAKGVWPPLVTSLPINSFLLPYRYTDFMYGGWSDDNGDSVIDFFDSDNLYDVSYTARTYNDFISGEEVSVFCSDVRNVLVPLIEQATQSIRICAFNFTDPLIISSVEKARKSGVSVTTYLDYSFCRQNAAQYPSFKKLSSVSDSFMLVRPLNGGLMRGGVVIIDGHTIVISSSGFSSNAFTSNDGYIHIINDAQLYVDSMENEFVKMKAMSCRWPDGDNFTGDCILYKYIDKY